MANIVVVRFLTDSPAGGDNTEPATSSQAHENRSQWILDRKDDFMLYVESFTLVMPGRPVGQSATAADEHGKIEAYSGQRAVKDYGISVKGSGAWAKGHINGSIHAYDYEAIYKVYDVDSSEKVNYWFVKYSKDTSQGQLKKVFESSQTTQLKYDLEFQIQGNDFGISSVYITYQVIRLTLAGVTKDFVTTNPANAGAVNPDGSTYPGGFKPISPGLESGNARSEAVSALS